MIWQVEPDHKELGFGTVEEGEGEGIFAFA